MIKLYGAISYPLSFNKSKKLSELKSWEQPVRFDNSIPLNELRFPIAYPRTILGWYSATADLISVQLKKPTARAFETMWF